VTLASDCDSNTGSQLPGKARLQTALLIDVMPVYRCYFIAQSYLSVKKYKEVLALYERALDYAQQSLDTHTRNEHDVKSKARI